MGKSVEVQRLPNCDICGEEAHYDARTKSGMWGNLCEKCFKKHGIGLGTGKGQKLISK